MIHSRGIGSVRQSDALPRSAARQRRAQRRLRWMFVGLLGSGAVGGTVPQAMAETLPLSSLNGANGFRINGVGLGDVAGVSVATMGDMTGDRAAELIIGAPYAHPKGSGSGATYVVFSTQFQTSAGLDLASLDGNNGFRID